MATLETRLRALATVVATKFNAIKPRLLAAGGTTSQMLVKASDTDYATSWVTGTTPAPILGSQMDRVAAQSIASVTDTAISFDTETLDEGGYWASGAPTNIVIPSTGWYNITGFVQWASATSASARTIYLRVAGATLVSQTEMPAAVAVSLAQSATIARKFIAGDIITLEVRQATGGSINVTSARLTIAPQGATGPTGATGATGAAGAISEFSTAPVNPAAGNMSIGARSLGNRNMLAARASAGKGREYVPMPHWGRCRYIRIQPSNGTSAAFGADGGNTNPTATGTPSTRSLATTNMFTRHRREGLVSAATAAAHASLTMNINHAFPGNGSGLGGYHLIMRFGCSDAATVAGARQFCGQQASMTNTNAEPSTFTDCIGIGNGAADTNLKLFYGGSVAQAPIDLGANFPANTLSTDMYELSLFADPDTQNVGYRVERLNTGHVAEGVITNTTPGTTLPASSTSLGFRFWRCNNATALAVGLDIANMSLETPY